MYIIIIIIIIIIYDYIYIYNNHRSFRTWQIGQFAGLTEPCYRSCSTPLLKPLVITPHPL